MTGRMSSGFVLVLVFAALAMALGGVPPTARAQGPDAGPEAADATTWNTNGNIVGGKAFLGTTNNRALKLKTNNVEQVRILPDGKVGIGTTAPNGKLQVSGDWSDALGYGALTLTGDKPTIRFSGGAASGNKNWLIHIGSLGPGNMEFFTGNTGVWSRIMSLTSEGVAIGATNALGSKLNVVGPDTAGSTVAFRVGNSAGSPSLMVFDDRRVGIGALNGSTTTHACYNGSIPYTFSACSSAAEYVPSIDDGHGFPETSDLVSMAPAVTNPYGDSHGPFVVRKSTTACDTNLLGFIVKPDSGADGVKLDEHYLPLAIYGYFPAKVTVSNGTIRRGDPITSSPKPGYGMKATGACKVIGYALQDATQDGTIQVFSHLTENALPEVASLRGEVDALKEANRALKQENEALRQALSSIDARLTRLEFSQPAEMTGALAQSLAVQGRVTRAPR